MQIAVSLTRGVKHMCRCSTCPNVVTCKFSGPCEHAENAQRCLDKVATGGLNEALLDEARIHANKAREENGNE